MNRGQRGGAHAFRLAGLLKVADTKSSLNKALTLLNYIVRLVDTEVQPTIYSFPSHWSDIS